MQGPRNGIKCPGNGAGPSTLELRAMPCNLNRIPDCDKDNDMDAALFNFHPAAGALVQPMQSLAGATPLQPHADLQALFGPGLFLDSPSQSELLGTLLPALLPPAALPVPANDPLANAVRIEGATPGCYALEIDDETYHGTLPGVSSTTLKKILRSPAHYQAMLREGNTDTAARRFGRAVHCYLLEPQNFDGKFAVWRGGDRKAAGYKAFEAQHQGKGILTADEFARVVGCAEALLAEPNFPLRGFLNGVYDASGACVVPKARTEFTIVWTDEATGLTCKIRTDALRLDTVIAYDVKTTGDARPESFVRELVRNNYDLQAAFYGEGVRRFAGQYPTFVFGAVESEAPHGACHYGLGPDHDLIRNGQRKYRHALDLMARCKAEDRWPGYAFEGIVDPVMEPWMVFRP